MRLSTVCGSDVHAWAGRRAVPSPAILGHEIVGVIEALGRDAAAATYCGRALAAGQRVTWTEYVACGRCAPALLDLPQKCVAAPEVRARERGRSAAPPRRLRGFCYLRPGTGIVPVPAELTDEEAAPVNCGVATMVAATEAAAIGPGDAVIVLGAGLLGLYGVAMARARGARLVVALDAVPARRALRVGSAPTRRDRRDGGRSRTRSRSSGKPARGTAQTRDRDGRRAEGPGATGLRMLRTGGRYVTAGLVVPGAAVTLDASRDRAPAASPSAACTTTPPGTWSGARLRPRPAALPLGELVQALPARRTRRRLRAAASRAVVRAAVVP